MILVIRNVETGEIKVLQNIEPTDEIELEEGEEIACSEYQPHDSLFNDDVYGSRPGEGGISEYYDRTAESESWNDRYENFRNQE